MTCVAPGCTNRTTNKSKRQQAEEESGIYITFHRIPKDKERRKIWIEAIGRSDWEPNKSSSLCSMHFIEDDFDKTSMAVTRLRENAVPSIFDIITSDYKKPRNYISSSKCFVPNCTTGYRSNHGKFSLFSVPANPNLRNIWEQNIQRLDRQLQSKDKVCEKHFAEENIIRFLEIGTVKHPYERPRLKKDAIPTIFPKCPTNLSKNSKKISGHINIKTEIFEEGDNVHVEMPSVSGVTESFCNVENTPRISNLIFLSITQENLAPFNWGFHLIENDDGNSKSVILTKLKLSHSEPIIYKSLVIKDDLSCSMHYLKHKIEESIVSSLSHIKDILRSMEEQNICKGGPSTSCYNPNSRSLPNAIVDKDFNCWRHEQCKIICGNQLQCDSCTNLFNSCTKKRKLLNQTK